MAAVVPPFYNFTGNYKPSGQDRTAAEGNYVAEATLRRRRILQAGMLFHKRNHNDFIGEERKI